MIVTNPEMLKEKRKVCTVIFIIADFWTVPEIPLVLLF